MEIGWLRSMGTFGDFWQQFFVQGNLTLQDSELEAGSAADAPTNPTRELAGASDYVANI